MTTAESKMPKAEKRFCGELSVWVVLTSVVGILAVVWVVLRLGDDADMKIPDEARLAALTLEARTGSWLGIDVQPVSDLLAQRLDLPDRRGVIVSYVYPASPAQEVGLAQGDVIRRIGETRVRDINQLGEVVAVSRPGDTLSLVVWRRGANRKLRVKLRHRPPEKQRSPVPLPGAEVEVEAAWLGLDIVPLTAVEAQDLGLPAGLRGMMVDGVAAGQGIDAGFLVGDVIVAVNGRSTRTITDFEEATERAVGAVVDVVRYGHHVYLSVPPPGAVGPSGKRLPRVQAM